MDFYIMKPGSAYDVSQFVMVEDGDQDEEGSLNLMTVSMGPATPLSFIFAYFNEFEEILKVDEVRQKEESEEEYNIRQLKLMTNSQFNAIYVAYQKAGLHYEVEYNGITVLNVLSGGASDGILKPGDQIKEIEGNVIRKSNDLISTLEKKKENDEVKFVIQRENELLDKKIVLKKIPYSDGKIGLGITYSENKKIKTDPKVKINAKDIGGPSAGLMFTLEILDQLTEGNLTKGYKIAGTGEMNEDGTVGRIGGVEKKVVAADEDGMEIFFAPDDEITDQMKKSNPQIVSNYEAAVETAKKIHSKMKIVPVKTIDDALQYLEKLPEKK